MVRYENDIIYNEQGQKIIERRKWLQSYSHECRNTRIKKKQECDPKTTIRMTQRKQNINAKRQEIATRRT